jgi:flagellar basal-body rod protein FlgG
MLATASTLLLFACQASFTAVRPPVELVPTDNPLHLAIDNSESTGNAYDYFVLTDPAGTRFYARDGAFKLDSAKTMVHELSGLQLVPRVTFPGDVTEIHIRVDGKVLIRRPGSDEYQDCEVITIARFPHPEGLTVLRNGLFLATPLSGPPVLGRPANHGFGLLRQGAVELPGTATASP